MWRVKKTLENWLFANDGKAAQLRALHVTKGSRGWPLFVITIHDCLTARLKRGIYFYSLLGTSHNCFCEINTRKATPTPLPNKHVEPRKSAENVELYCCFLFMCKIYSYNMRWIAQIELFRFAENKSRTFMVEIKVFTVAVRVKRIPHEPTVNDLN